MRKVVRFLLMAFVAASLLFVGSSVLSQEPMEYKTYLPLVEKNYCSVPNAFVFTSIPQKGSNADLTGYADQSCYPRDKYQVAVYIYTFGWYNKPYWDKPTTPINANGSWTCDITTGSGDEQAVGIAAFIIPKDYYPPMRYGQGYFPDELLQKAIAELYATR